MTDTPINLNKARKQRDRAAAKRRADENAAKHGLTKAQRTANDLTAKLDAARIARHKLSDDG